MLVSLDCGSMCILFRADDVASDFALRGIEAQSIHGDRYRINGFSSLL